VSGDAGSEDPEGNHSILLKASHSSCVQTAQCTW